MLFMCILLSGCGNSDDGRIRMPFRSGSYSGMTYQDAVSKLEEAGFTNISFEALGDLITGWMYKDGEVKSITVDGDDTFNGDSKYLPDAPIIISYHSFDKGESKNENEEKKTEEKAVSSSAIEDIFPKEYAKRAVVVAITNAKSPYVIASNGSDYDVSKFRSYSDVGDDFWEIISDGAWTVKANNTWHVEELKLKNDPLYLNPGEKIFSINRF